MTTVSLVVSTLGRTAELSRLLRSLSLQHFKDFELIVVDQNPPGVIGPLLAAEGGDLPITHITSEKGLSLGRNVGLRAARGRIVAFPDDDCWYRPHLIADVVDAFERTPSVDVLVGRTVDAEFAESLGRFPKTRRMITRANIWRAGNSNTIFARAHPRLGLGFDETLGVGANTIFQSGEETDFLLRLLARGASIVYEPAIVVHHDQVNLRRSAGAQRARQYAPGVGRVLRVHRFGLDRVAYFSVRPLVRACLAALAGDMALAHYKWNWAQGVVRGYLAPGECAPKARAH